MKKWLPLFLMFVTLAGTFYPCCLVDECNEEEKATATKNPTRETEGNCSPFFACASCPGFAAMLTPIQIAQAPTANLVHNHTFVVSYITSYTSSFWKPPRNF